MRILIINQTFHPDVAATAQHAADIADYLVRCGHQVDVLCAGNGYDDERVSYPAVENWKGVNIFRIRTSRLGKKSKFRRVGDAVTFMMGVGVRVLSRGRYDHVIALSSPPLISVVAALGIAVRGGRLVCWVMDLNPDEAFALGWCRADSLVGRTLSGLMNWSLRRADVVIALDRFMKARLVEKGVEEFKILIIPPWLQDEVVRYDQIGREEFRRCNGFDGKFVIMYSGNHSPCHPLDTLLAAAERLAGDPRVLFCFVGGGTEFKRIAYCRLRNVRCLPYQPATQLSASLSSADLQVVVMGEPFVGIVHPCKVYNLLAIGAPVLYIGPPESHVTDIVCGTSLGESIVLRRHGDVDGVVSAINNAVSTSVGRQVGMMAAASEFSRERVVSRLEEALMMGCGKPVDLAQAMQGPVATAVSSNLTVDSGGIGKVVAEGDCVRAMALRHSNHSGTIERENGNV